MSRLYLTPEAYTASLPEGASVPERLPMLLRVASQLVDRLLTGRVYDVDTLGVPTDPDVTATLAEATAAIVAELDTRGALTPGGAAQWDQVKIGSVSLGSRTTAAPAAVVDGLPVPALAVSLLGSVGPFGVVTAARRDPRPLDRIARDPDLSDLRLIEDTSDPGTFRIGD